MSRKLAFAAMVAVMLALPGSAQAKRHDGKKLHRVKHVVVTMWPGKGH